MPLQYPEPFLEVRVDHLDLTPPFVALCAGYDGGSWRADRLADHLFQWLPFAALSQEHQLSFAAHNFVEMLRLAAAHIYNTKKTASRGELGEILLHIACVLHFQTFPVLCKLVLKSSANDTVKGFDGVHLQLNNTGFEIWLGESKFYEDPKRAIRDAVRSVKDHLLPAFITSEKAMIFGHIAKDIPHQADVVKLFKSKTSGDELLKRAVFPILIAYDSLTTANHCELCEQYTFALETEIGDLHDYFLKRAGGTRVRFRLIFVPMNKKLGVVESFDKKLEPFL